MASQLRLAKVVLLIIVLGLSAAGCSTARAGTPATSDSPAATLAPSARGPYVSGTVVVSGNVEYSLTGVTIADARWVRYAERKSGGLHPGTPAAGGHRYVDATVTVRNRTAPTDSTRPVLLGETYVVADGKRYPSVSTGSESRPTDASQYSLHTEYELPVEAHDVVMYLPTSKAATETISFRLW